MQRYTQLVIYLIIYVAAIATPLRAQHPADYRLKVLAAGQAGLDTLPELVRQMDAYRHAWQRRELTDETLLEQEAARLYNKLLAQGRLKQTSVRQIFFPLPQNATKSTIRRAEMRMDSLSLVLKGDTAAARFVALSEQFSAEKLPLEIIPLQMPAEFEQVVDSLRVGQCSSPFHTPMGIHLVRVVERREAPPFEVLRPQLMERLARNLRTDKATQESITLLKERHNFTPDKQGVSELLATGKTRHPLFTLDGKPFGGEAFERFSQARPGTARRRLDEFTVKSLLDYADQQLENTDTLFRRQMQQFRDSLLVAAITRREIDEKYPSDDAALQAYFDAHRKAYRWETPRYRGIVLHCATKKVGKQVRKLLKQLPENEWMDAIRLGVNTGGMEQVRAEQGTFSPGDNPYVDHKIFKKGGRPAPDVSFPFTVFLGKKQKEPKHLDEVREAVRTDYRRSLEEAWLERLRATVKVEIDQEVLKTVNNQ